MLAFFGKVCYYIEVAESGKQNPGVAKFGIALEWGSRGLEFESRHSDQKDQKTRSFLVFFFYFVWKYTEKYAPITNLLLTNLEGKNNPPDSFYCSLCAASAIPSAMM